MMATYFVLGYLVVILNISIIVILGLAAFTYYQRKELNLQILTVMLALVLLLPIFSFESFLFVDLHSTFLNLSYSNHVMKFLFVLGIAGILMYNIHLLSIDDFPTIPLSLLSTLTGIAIGSSMNSVNLNINDLRNPIMYDPISGGLWFFISLVLMNALSAIGFFHSIFYKKYNYHIDPTKIHGIDVTAIILFLISPLVIMVIRLIWTSVLPFNFVFFLPHLSFSLHLILYMTNPKNSGYPTHSIPTTVSILDISQKIVLAGYSQSKETDFGKLQGLTIMAIESVITETFHPGNTTPPDGQVYYYGDTLLLRENNNLIVGYFQGKAKKLGKFVLKFLLNNFIQLEQENIMDLQKFQTLVDHSLHIFLHKKLEVTSKNVYYGTG